MLPLPYSTPFSRLTACPARTRSEILRLSSWAKVAMIDRRSSPSPSMVRILSLTKYTSTPNRFRSRVMDNVSTVFRAKRHTSRVTIKSNIPALASTSIFRKAGRFLAAVPVMPRSKYRSTTLHSGWRAVRSSYQACWFSNAESWASCSVETRP